MSFRPSTNLLSPSLVILGNTTEIRDKYAAAPYDTDPIAINLVHALGEYVFQIAAEYSDEIKEAAA